MDVNYPAKTDLPEKGKMYDNYKKQTFFEGYPYYLLNIGGSVI